MSITVASAQDATAQDATAARRTTIVSPTQPLQHALDAAADGDTLVLAAGVHHGPVTITRRIALRGEARGQAGATPAASIVGNLTGSVITVAADGASVENLEVRDSGRDLSNDDAGILVVGHDVRITGIRARNNLHGIYARYANGVHVTDSHITGLAKAVDAAEHASDAAEHAAHDQQHDEAPRVLALMGNGIHLFNAPGARVERNRVEFVRDGIYVAHTSGATFRGNRISDSRYGIHYMYSSNNVIADNELWANVAGPALMFSSNLTVTGNLLRDHAGFRAYGLLLQNVEQSAIYDNEIRGNRVAMRLQYSTANDIRRNHLHGNLAGTTLTSSSRDNVFADNRFGYNLRQIELTGPTPSNSWSADGAGNYWQGALPMDVTGDGISDFPHHEVDVMADVREAFPAVQLLTGSLGVRLIEWALGRVPPPGTRHVTDPHPRIRP